MKTWVIVSWVFVAILTGVNIYVFLKLKQASEQMLKMAFPNAKNMNEALEQMQKMMGGLGGAGMAGAGARGGRPGVFPNHPLLTGGSAGAGKKGAPSEAQLKAAMDLLKKQGGKK
jgi:uncharacterized protein YneF (UPF0154 family)